MILILKLNVDFNADNNNASDSTCDSDMNLIYQSFHHLYILL